MQTYRDNELLQTETANTREELLKKAHVDSTSVVIGNLPCRGEVVTINGLKFDVLSKSDRQGTLHLKIQKPPQ